MRQLATCRWVEEHQNIVITGPTGTGKTYLACALAQQACRKGYRAVYRRATRLNEEVGVGAVCVRQGELLVEAGGAAVDSPVALAARLLGAYSGQADRPFRPMPITRSGRGDHPGA